VLYCSYVTTLQMAFDEPIKQKSYSAVCFYSFSSRRSDWADIPLPPVRLFPYEGVVWNPERFRLTFICMQINSASLRSRGLIAARCQSHLASLDRNPVTSAYFGARRGGPRAGASGEPLYPVSPLTLGSGVPKHFPPPPPRRLWHRTIPMSRDGVTHGPGQ